MWNKFWILAAFLFLLIFDDIQASQWVYVGPAGAQPNEFVPDRKDPSLWYATQSGTLYRSTDGAKSWKPIAEGGYDLFVNPADSSVYVRRYSGGGQWKSNDHGETFEPLGRWPHPSENPVRFSRTDGRYLYRLPYSPRDYFSESIDGGERWRERKPALFAAIGLPGCSLTKFRLYDLVVSPVSEQSLSISIRITGCSIKPHTRAAIATSNDRGATWAVSFAEPDGTKHSYFIPFRFLDDPAVRAVYAYTGGGQIADWDGNNWRAQPKVPCPKDGTNCRINRIFQTLKSDELIVTESVENDRRNTTGCLIFTNANGKWSKPENSKLDCDNGFYAMAQPYGDFLSYSGLGLRRIINGRLLDSNQGFPTRLKLYKPTARDDHVYAIAGSNKFSLLYASKDGGKTWNVVDAPMRARSEVVEVEVSPHNSKIVVLILRNVPSIHNIWDPELKYYIYKTMNAGRSWLFCKSVRAAGGSTIIAFDRVNAGTVYIRIGLSLYRSTQNGLSPEFASAPWIYDLVVDPFVSGRLYATNCEGVLRSDDSGKTFFDASNGIPKLDYCSAVYISALPKKGQFLVQNDQNAMMHTIDGGKNWKKISKVPSGWSGLGSYRPPGARRFYARSKSVIFASSNHGMFKSTDSANTWQRIPLTVGVYDMSDPSLGPLYLLPGYGYGGLLKEEK